MFQTTIQVHIWYTNSIESGLQNPGCPSWSGHMLHQFHSAKTAAAQQAQLLEFLPTKLGKWAEMGKNLKETGMFTRLPHFASINVCLFSGVPWALWFGKLAHVAVNSVMPALCTLDTRGIASAFCSLETV